MANENHIHAAYKKLLADVKEHIQQGLPILNRNMMYSKRLENVMVFNKRLNDLLRNIVDGKFMLGVGAISARNQRIRDEILQIVRTWLIGAPDAPIRNMPTRASTPNRVGGSFETDVGFVRPCMSDEDLEMYANDDDHLIRLIQHRDFLRHKHQTAAAAGKPRRSRHGGGDEASDEEMTRIMNNMRMDEDEIERPVAPPPRKKKHISSIFEPAKTAPRPKLMPRVKRSYDRMLTGRGTVCPKCGQLIK